MSSGEPGAVGNASRGLWTASSAAAGAAAGAGLGGSGLASAVGAALFALVGAGAAEGLRARRMARSASAGPGPRSPELARRRALQSVLDGVPDAVILFSELGRIRYANPAARELFFAGANAEGQNFLRLLSGAPAHLRDSLLGETDRVFSVDVEGRRESYHLSRRELDRDLDPGEGPGTVLVVKRVTREIRRRELEVLRQVVRVVSHEVNNSLAPISSLMHSARRIAERVDRADEFRRVFDTVQERTEHLQGFLAGYARLARLPRPSPRLSEWAPLVEQITTLHPGVRVPQVPVARGYFDPAQIEQVLLNLIKNARESRDPGEVAVEIRIQSDEAGASEIEVLDDGPGFSREALEGALLPLYTTKQGGGGMGLSLCREIVESHGGALGLSNRGEGGARVTLSLPAESRTAGGTDPRSRLTLSGG